MWSVQFIRIKHGKAFMLWIFDPSECHINRPSTTYIHPSTPVSIRAHEGAWMVNFA